MNDGLLRFARYAFPPNRLGYCGTDDNAALLGYLSESRSDGGLLDLARKFEGAYPYLRLIAATNGLQDPFDDRVVQAYWIGNELLEKVGASALYRSLKERFRTRMDSSSFQWMTAGLADGTTPHHNFHVLEVYRRAGLMRDDRAAVALDRMDQCRISWGRVTAVEGGEAIVERSPLELRDGKLGLGRPVPVRVTRRLGAGEDGVVPGRIVSIHWSWICDALDARGLHRLQRETFRAVHHTNATL